MKAIYDEIGIDYALKRQTEPRIAKQIFAELEGADKVINIGAGAGSYEPSHLNLVAVEPSHEMISQRPIDSHEVVQASAESLPFADKSFSHAMTVLSMHHWKDRKAAFQEINRVTRTKFIALSWDPDGPAFWLTRDYFPELIDLDRKIFPRLEELSLHFDNVKQKPLMIPEDCIDGFLAAYWKKPAAYLDENVRNSISTFCKIDNLNEGLAMLESDIESGEWFKKNEAILNEKSIDAGYVLITGDIKKTQ